MVLYPNPSYEVWPSAGASGEVPNQVGLNEEILEKVALSHVQELGFDSHAG